MAVSRSVQSIWFHLAEGMTAFRLLVTEPMGNVILAMGVASWALGQVTLFRMTKVEI